MRIVLIGAGSVVFARRLLGDLLSYPALSDAVLVLNDIDPDRLRTAERMAYRLAQSTGVRPTVEAHLDRRMALRDADFVINTIEVGGARATRLDFDIPARYGLHYAINDTIGVGGVMRGLRTIGPVLDIVADMEELCPDAWLLNHTNPMSMVVRAIAHRSGVRTVGLCHAVSNTVADVGRYLAIPADEIDFRSGGVNHVSFMLELEHAGRDIYPDLRAFATREPLPANDLVRLELLRRLSYYPTELSEHHADYNPWFIPKSGAIERYNVPVGEYLSRVDDGLADYASTVAALDSDEGWSVERSHEYSPSIIAAVVTGVSIRIVGNIMNTGGVLPDLPLDACVEVPCLVDATGVQAESVGPLPSACAAYIRGAVDTQILTVNAALEQDRDAIYHAVMQDPIVAATLDLESVWSMTDELIAAQAEWLPGWLGGSAGA